MSEDNLKFTLRSADERGGADFGWLKSRHSFSFGNYHDPRHMGFANLRVINDDVVEGGKGFGAHSHSNAEIFSYVLDGALEHKDSLGNGSIVDAGGVQYMSAGSGVQHSEFNPSQTIAMRFLQIWLLPTAQNTSPRYATMNLTPEEKAGRFKLFLSPDGREDSMRTEADACVYAATFDAEQTSHMALRKGRYAWVQVADGELRVGGHQLRKGDGLAIEGEGEIIFSEGRLAELLYFDLPSLKSEIEV